jgi:regulation of enolase protein 1 (concanavalin A-like superfamily)
MDQSRRRIRRRGPLSKVPSPVKSVADRSSVVANPLSDWAMQPCPVDGPLTLRLTAEPGRHAKVHLEYKKGDKWIPFREVTGWAFVKGEDMDIGVMACSPGDSGFRVEFWDVIGQDYSELAYQRSLHEGAVVG